ncbi:MAG: type IV pili methyl-accepting chemotaxis transducer N-terminal domain-containing protein [Gammaproteobacteria bacterium]|nr:type IV pili methyl-accepting chemotaxis transducer N-terminal domain-containing protein [Gammaproteobacteria bacterium]
MKQNIRIFLCYAPALLVSLMFGLLSWPAQAEALPGASKPIDLATAVSMAGRQRMLTQRMVKAYLMLGQGITPDNAQTILQTSIDQFESQLASLKSLQPDHNVQTSLKNLESDWKKFKPLITATPSEKGAAILYEANEELQKVAHKLTLAYDSTSISPHVHLINLAGRQRMLTQRTAKHYLYRTWGLYKEAADMEIHLSRAHFTTVLLQLENSPYASKQISELATQIRSDWEPYKQALLATRDPAKMRDYAQGVCELSEQLLAKTEQLVTLVVLQAQQKPN